MKINAFYARIGSIMKDNMYDREIVGFRSGKIANRTLYKSQIPNATKLFSRKQERANKQYAISILLDVSGSMKDAMDYNSGSNEDRLQVATDMVELLVKGLERNNIRFALTFYGDGFQHYKLFDQKLNKNLLEDAKEVCNSRMGNSTQEYLALEESYKIIRNEKGTRDNRFVFVFTDGGCSDIEEPLKKLQKIAKVFPFGIGIDIKHNHGAGMKVCNREVFMFKLLKSLENNISRG